MSSYETVRDPQGRVVMIRPRQQEEPESKVRGRVWGADPADYEDDGSEQSATRSTGEAERLLADRASAYWRSDAPDHERAVEIVAAYFKQQYPA